MKEIITELADIWPTAKIVHGRARHSQSQGGVERLNRTVEEKLAIWMRENNCQNWVVGRLFVRWQINTQVTRATGEMPYRAAFGQCPRVGLSSLPLDPALRASIQTELELNEALGVPEGVNIEDCSGMGGVV